MRAYSCRRSTRAVQGLTRSSWHPSRGTRTWHGRTCTHTQTWSESQLEWTVRKTNMIRGLWDLTEAEEVDTWNSTKTFLLLSSPCSAQIGNHVAIIVTCLLHLYLGILNGTKVISMTRLIPINTSDILEPRKMGKAKFCQTKIKRSHCIHPWGSWAARKDKWISHPVCWVCLSQWQ